MSQGIAVELTVEPAREGDRVAGGPRAGVPLRFRFRFSDTTSHTPLAGLAPAAWVDARPSPAVGGGEAPAVSAASAASAANAADTERTCTSRVAGFLSGGFTGGAELDLNGAQVVVMNDDASLSVLDAYAGFGGTRLLAAIPLAAPAADWAFAEARERLYVSEPAAGKVAVVDTGTWRIVSQLEAGPASARLALEPGGRRLWVLHQGAARDAVSAIDLEDEAGGRSLPMPSASTGGAPGARSAWPGPHRLAFSADGRKGYLTNGAFGAFGANGTVSVIDLASGRELRRLPAGRTPGAVAYSPLAGAAFVVSGADGVITVIDGASDQVAATLTAEPGLEELRFAPGGRLGFVLNPAADLLHILDAATRRIVQTGRMEKRPDQVVFSDTLAYIRHSGSESVLMVPLAKAGEEGQPIPVADFPGGRSPLGGGPEASLADGLAKVPGMNAMLVANPADRRIYLYREGMAAPAGDLGERTHAPRALLMVDRGLRERAPGVYETTATLRRAGPLTVALLLDSPKLVHCFDITLAAARAAPAGTRGAGTKATAAVEARLDLAAGRSLTAGRPETLRLRLRERASGRPLDGLPDVRLLLQAAGSNWSLRRTASPAAGGGYEVILDLPGLPGPGLYYVYLECPSLGLKMRDSPPMAIAAVAAREGENGH